MIDLKDLQANSNQMNAVDFVKPMVFKIERVEYNPTQEQPIKLHLQGYEGRPWKPCKSMLRGLCKVWGMDEQQWNHKLIELYCDPSVKWAGKEAGGIRVSAVSGIDKPVELTVQLNRKQREIQTWGVLADDTPIDHVFVITHWEADINEAESNDAISAIVQAVNNQFGADALNRLKETVINARAKFASSESQGV